VFVLFASWRVKTLGAVQFPGRRQPLYVYTAVIYLLPSFLLLEGLFGPPLCVPRYLAPVAAGTVFLIAELCMMIQALLPAWLRESAAAGTLCLATLLICLLAYDIFYLARYNAGLQKDYTGTLTSQLPKSVPVVCEDGFAFTELIALQHDSEVPYTFLLDWKTAVAPRAPKVEVTQYHLMENWKKHGFFSGSIRGRDEFLLHTPVFYTLSFVDSVQADPFKPPTSVERYPSIGNPLHVELAANPEYKVHLKKVIPLGELTAKVWQICQTDVEPCE
jgi:hypothetical protein